MIRRFFYSAEQYVGGGETRWAYGNFVMVSLLPPSPRKVMHMAASIAQKTIEKNYGDMKDKPVRLIALNRL